MRVRYPSIRRTAGIIKRNTTRAVTCVRQTALVSRGRLVRFLEPFWDEKEQTRAANWNGSLPNQTQSARLEREFLDRLSMEGCAIATSSGRTALELALRVLRQVRPATRKEVVIPSYSCRGVLDPIVRAGLVPRLVDIGHDLNVTVEAIEPHMNERTLAVVAVHLGGKYLSDLQQIETLAERSGAVVVEDACQSLGGVFRGVPFGGKGRFAIFSFGLGKNLTATAGGMLVARDYISHVNREAEHLRDEDPQQVVRRRDAICRVQRPSLWTPLGTLNVPAEPFASAHEYCRMSSLDVELTRCQLAKLPEIVERRTKNARVLLSGLSGTHRIEVPGARGPNVWTKFPVITRSEEGARQIRRYLARKGVETESLYVPLHLRDCARGYARQPLPVCESVFRRVFSVPVRPSLSQADMAEITDLLRCAMDRLRDGRVAD